MLCGFNFYKAAEKKKSARFLRFEFPRLERRGRVVEMGSFAQLMETNGKFRVILITNLNLN